MSQVDVEKEKKVDSIKKEKKPSKSRAKPKKTDKKEKSKEKSIEDEIFEDIEDEISEEVIEEIAEEESESDGKTREEPKRPPLNSIYRLDLERDKSLGLVSKADSIYEQMIDNKIYTLDEVLMLSAKELAKLLSGVGEKKAKAIIEKAKTLYGTPRFVSLSEITTTDEYIETGSIALDNLLGGGFKLGDSYELFGSAGGAKTQTCATIACRVQLPKEKGGLRKEGEPIPEVLWFDSEDTLLQMMSDTWKKEIIKKKAKEKGVKPSEYAREIVRRKVKSRFKQICEPLGLDFDKDVRPYITYVKVVRVVDQQQVVEDALEMADQHNWKVIIFDSISKLVRAERKIEESFNMKTSRILGNTIQNLALLRDKCNAVLICTNQVYKKTSWIDSDRLNEVTYGGTAVLHNLNNRIHIWKNNKGERFAELVDSSNLPNIGPVKFRVTDRGIEDIEDD